MMPLLRNMEARRALERGWDNRINAVDDDALDGETFIASKYPQTRTHAHFAKYYRLPFIVVENSLLSFVQVFRLSKLSR